MNKIKILFLSAGSRSIEAVLDCLQPIRSQLFCAGTNSLAAFVSLIDLDAAFIVPETSHKEAYQQRLGQIIKEFQPDLIINGRDEEVPLIAELVQGTLLEKTYPKLSIASIYTDKYSTYHFCRANGLPFVKTAISSEEVYALVEDKGLPIIAKPRFNGHASKNVFVLFKLSEVQKLLEEGGYIFQPFVGPISLQESYRKISLNTGVPLLWNPGNTYYNIDFVFDQKSQEVNRCITKALRSGSIIKEMWLAEDPLMESIADTCSAALSAAGHRGPLNIQGYLNGETYDVFEWNARFVGSTYGFALLGKNLVMDWLKATINNLPIENLAPVEKGKVFRPMRYRLVAQERIDALEKNGEWYL
jgi:carbamoyl-phosphate synthase large subunit